MKIKFSKGSIAAWLSVAGLAAYVELIVAWSRSNGVRHSTNFELSSFVPLILVGTGVVTGGLATLILTLRARPASGSIRFLYVQMVVAAVAVLAPYPLAYLWPYLTTRTERRDYEQFGPLKLRQAAADLARVMAARDDSGGWFGAEVPPHEVPAALHEFIPGAANVSVDEHGVVVMCTDGLASTRSGYAIVPAGSSFIPESSRRIADGFYYVSSHH